MALKVLGINHVAIAHDQSGNLEKVFEILGIQFQKSEDVLEQKVKTSFFSSPSPNFAFELLTPTSEDSVIQKYLDTKGSGIHHFCIEVNDVNEAMKALTEKKIRLLYPQAKSGAHNAKINFIHPKDSGGILIEIAQYK